MGRRPVTADMRLALLRAAGHNPTVDGYGRVSVRTAATGWQWQPVDDDRILELIGATKS
jgi:hypothetical protein